MTFAGWFGILVSIVIFGQWGFFLATGQVPELKTEPIRLSFHLAAEFGTAILLLISGIALLNQMPWARTLYLIAVGMLAYSVIVSPGYFAQEGQWPFVGLFIGLLALAVVSVVLLWNSAN